MSGHLSSVAAGILEGDVEFPVRGTFSFKMERRPNDTKGECALLTCKHPYATADMVLIVDMDHPDFWHGQIPIEGYWYFVRIQKDGKRMAINFHDAIQPIVRKRKG